MTYNKAVNLFHDEEQVIENVGQQGTDDDASCDFPWRMAYPFLERRMPFLLQNGLQFRPHIIDVMRMLSGLVSEIHRIISEKHAECERYGEEHAIETVLQPDQHRHAARQSAME